MNDSLLECRSVRPDVAEGLGQLFERLRKSGTEDFFHPHPLTAEEAVKRANYQGNDLYYVLADRKFLIGYGILRGWDEGYETPSLGLALDEAVRGQGYGRMFMHFLHAAAVRRGATKIRLKAHRNNSHAIELYKSLGYEFGQQEGDQLVGYLKIGH
jgi:ribosomal protein S18 acetylase RimI-like enzyme